jgi:DNA ligase-1
MNKVQLYGKSKNGKIKEWSICVDKINLDCSVVKIEHGYQGGKKQVDSREVNSGKNIGKKNETTPYQQALFEAKSLINKKLDENYAYSVAEIPRNSDGMFLPMLAQSYDKHHKKIKFPSWVQPKLDGARMLAKKENGEVRVWSRKGKEILTLTKIKSELDLVLKEGECLDGEVYVHGWDFQRIISAIKKEKDDTNLLEYHIYDSPHLTKTFEDRFVNSNLREVEVSSLKWVETKKVENYMELCKNEMTYIILGYEGLMVRNELSLYKYKDRSYDLQKVKRFEDEEFRIIGGKDGVGREEGSVVFRCITEDGLPFDVRPKGTKEERIEWFKELDNLIGENLTVRFQGRTRDGIPRFPVGLRVRPNFDK